MNFTEQAIVFPCASNDLLGIVAMPEQINKIGVLIVVGGPQYRAGSHRQFLLLSRALAISGYPVMRFDHSGLGDSTGETEHFEALNGNILAAISAFQQKCPNVNNVVLWGLCDAASASLLYWDATHDARIVGMVLLNPWVRSEATLAKTQIKHYYGQRLLQAEFWQKLLTGKLSVGLALKGLLANLNKSHLQSDLQNMPDALLFQKKMLRGVQEFEKRVLIVLSGNDYIAKEFLEATMKNSAWQAVLSQTNITQVSIRDADHTFSSVEWRRQVEQITLQWLETIPRP